MKRLAFALAVSFLLVVSTPVLASTIAGNQALVSPHFTYTIALYLLPDSDGYYTQLTPEGAANNWDCVNDPVLTPDGDTSRVGSSDNTDKKDAYNLTAPDFMGNNQTITSVTVFFRCTGDGQQAQPFIGFSSTNETTGTLVNLTTTWVTYNESLTRPGGGTWATADFTNLQVGIRLKGTSQFCTQVYVRVLYTSEEAQAPPFVLGEPPDWITAPTISGNFTTSVNPTFPLSDLIQDVSDASGIPSQLPFVIIAGVIILACSLMFAWFLRRFGAMSLFLKIFVIWVLMGIMGAVGWLDLWILVIAVLIMIALAMGSQTKWTSTTG